MIDNHKRSDMIRSLAVRLGAIGMHLATMAEGVEGNDVVFGPEQGNKTYHDLIKCAHEARMIGLRHNVVRQKLGKVHPNPNPDGLSR